MPDRRPVLDLVVPFHGPRELLEEAVRSVLAQDRDDWRLLVVEDGDQQQGVGAWLAGLHDDRVRHVLNPSTLGVAGNFQRCLDLVEADLVTFLGYDDRLLPSYAGTVVGLATRHPDAVALMPGVRVVDQDGSPVRSLTDATKRLMRPRAAAPVRLAGEGLLTSLLHGNWSYFPATCWRRDAAQVVGFRADLPVTLDLALLATLVLDGGAVVVEPGVHFEYRRHRGSASSLAARETDRFAEERRLLGELAAACRQRGWRRAERAARLRLTSRAHAVALLPLVLRSRPGRVGPLLRHAAGR